MFLSNYATEFFQYLQYKIIPTVYIKNTKACNTHYTHHISIFVHTEFVSVVSLCKALVVAGNLVLVLREDLHAE